LILFTSQLFCRGEPGGAAADDQDSVWHLAEVGWTRSFAGCDCLLLGMDEDPAASAFDRPTGDRIESGRMQDFSRAQTKAGVVPRTAYRVVDHQALGERPPVVAAARADGKDLFTATGNDNRFLADVAQERLPIGEIIERQTLH